MSASSSSVLYLKKLSGFKQEINDVVVEPMFYQPTPDGLKLLCAHYCRKYGIDLSSLDLRDKVESPDNIFLLFKQFSLELQSISLTEGKVKGVILSHGQHHVVPIVISRKESKLNIIVFDSTSGSRIKGYFRIANLFPHANFYLNAGTRQADGSSCITDAVCILKEALQLTNLLQLVEKKKIDEHPSYTPPSQSYFKCEPKPKHFSLFKVPEQLLLTAQRNIFVEDSDADMNVKLRDGTSLGEYRHKFKLSVSLQTGKGVEEKEINSYLFIKSKVHKSLMDQRSSLSLSFQ